MGNERNFFERHPVSTMLVVLGVLVLLADVGFGVGYRLIVGYPYYTPGLVRNVAYHHDFAPNVAVENAAWGPASYRLTTNSLGFKDKVVRDVALTTDAHRILLIGDSFTEGVGFPYEDTFAGLVGERLEGRGIEVLNAAVSSYSPIIYWRKVKYLIEEVGLDFDELAVFIDISDIADEARHYRLDENGAVAWRGRDDSPEAWIAYPFREWLKRNTILSFRVVRAVDRVNAWRLPPPARSALEERHMAAEAAAGVNISDDRGLWTIDPYYRQSYGEEGLRRARGSMDRLRKLMQFHGKRLTIAIYPWPAQVYADDIASIQVKFWTDWARQGSVDILNYFPCFFPAPDDRGTRLDTLRRYYVAGDVHWNAAGHKVVADGFLAFREGGAAGLAAFCEERQKLIADASSGIRLARRDHRTNQALQGRAPRRKRASRMWSRPKIRRTAIRHRTATAEASTV
jgi:hypothetical protein